MEQGSSKKNNIIVLCVVIAVIAVALVAYFVISGQKNNGQPAVSATMELNTVNIYGAWYKKAGDSTYELRFKDNKELFPIVTIVLMEVFINKMRRLKGTRKMLIIEEAWKALASNNMASYVQYLCAPVQAA